MNFTLTKYTIALICVLLLGLGLGFGIGYFKYHTEPVPVLPPVLIHDTIPVPHITHVPIPVYIHDTINTPNTMGYADKYYTAYAEDIIYEDTIGVTYLSPTFLDTTGADYFSITMKPHPEIRDTVKLTQIEYVDQPCPNQFKTITYSAGIGGLVGVILTLLLLR
jgi:hypothetical protein